MGVQERTSGVTELTRQIAALRAAQAEEDERHDREVASLRLRIEEAERRREIVAHGVPLETVTKAEALLEVHGRGNACVGKGLSVLTDAITDLAAEKPRLRVDYFGTKNYDRWRGQRCDVGYGMAPTHGAVIFSVGLKPEARERDLTEDERDAAIAYLLAIREAVRDA